MKYSSKDKRTLRLLLFFLILEEARRFTCPMHIHGFPLSALSFHLDRLQSSFFLFSFLSFLLFAITCLLPTGGGCWLAKTRIKKPLSSRLHCSRRHRPPHPSKSLFFFLLFLLLLLLLLCYFLLLYLKLEIIRCISFLMLLLPQSGTPLLPRPWLFTFFRARFFHFFQLPSAGLTHHPLSHKQPCSQLLQPIDEMEEVGVESPIGFSNRCSGQPKGADWKVSESWRLNNKPHLSVPIHSLKQREVLSTHFNIVFLFCRDS